MKTTDGPLKALILEWLKEFQSSSYDLLSPNQQLADFLTNKLQRARKPELLNPKTDITWKRCYLCGTPMNPKYDPEGTANCGNACCGR